MGGGIASRFSLALSKIIDPTTESNITGNTAAQDDDDITEMITLIEELNQHTDLTVKLSNQAKICKIFAKFCSRFRKILENFAKQLLPRFSKIKFSIIFCKILRNLAKSCKSCKIARR